MERKIEKYLKAWKEEQDSRPLVLYGKARVGKTYTVLDFAEKEYKNVLYFDTYKNEELEKILKSNSTVDRLIRDLEVLSHDGILEKLTLLVFDNLINPKLLDALKIFNTKEGKKFDVIIITSLKDKIISKRSGDFQYKEMYPLDFEEFLKIRGEKELIEYIKLSFEKGSQMPFHKVAMDYFYEFLIIGQSPEALKFFLENKKLSKKNNLITENIINKQTRMFLYQDNLIDIERALDIYDSIYKQYLKDNHKFQYSVIKEGSRKSDYEDALNFLVDNSILLKSHKVEKVSLPLSSKKDEDNFKLYYSDSSIMFYKQKLNQYKLLSSKEYKKIMFEQYVSSTLSNMGYSLYHYQSSGKAEIDFVIQNREGEIIPLEIIYKENSKSKAMSVFLKEYQAKNAYRLSLSNFKYDKKVKTIPIYALFCLENYI